MRICYKKLNKLKFRVIHIEERRFEMSNSESMKEMLEEELNKRFAIIEAPDYKYVKGMRKADFVGMFAVGALMIIVIILGLI